MFPSTVAWHPLYVNLGWSRSSKSQDGRVDYGARQPLINDAAIQHGGTVMIHVQFPEWLLTFHLADIVDDSTLSLEWVGWTKEQAQQSQQCWEITQYKLDSLGFLTRRFNNYDNLGSMNMS